MLIRSRLVALFYLGVLAGCGNGALEFARGDVDVDDEADQTISGAAAAAKPAPFGDPIPGLRASLRARFAAGKEAFERIHSPETGLGPVFNDTRCGGCHSVPATGGTSVIDVVRFGKKVDESGFVGMPELGGSVQQRLGIQTPTCQQPGEEIPAEADVVVNRQTQPVFGLGYLEAVPEETIRALADPDDANGDGISGRVHETVDLRTAVRTIGRFGWKAQMANLIDFTADALLNEMGLTTPAFPEENLPQGKAAVCDDGIPHVADDADLDGDGLGDINAKMADFMRLAAVPPTAGPSTAQTRRGAKLFAKVGCTGCHVATLVTGTVQGVPQLSNKKISAYTDLLLHDMGILGDGVVQGYANANEFRTPPLWGLRTSEPYLHNGIAQNVFEAITFHDGEGRAARDAFSELTFGEQEDLLAFLDNL